MSSPMVIATDVDQADACDVQALRAGDGSLYLAGGVENMSCAPFLLHELRSGHKLGSVPLIDSLVNDGLTDPTHRYHMGVTAENVAKTWDIGRGKQDAFAFESHRRAVAAENAGRFTFEILPFTVPSRKGAALVERDESVRSDTSLDALAKLKPVFQVGGTVTAGNASGLNDGAAMLALCNAEYALAHGLEPLAEIVGYAAAGVDPAIMGMGPAKAGPLALSRCGFRLADVDLFELNEAFAAQAIAVCRELKLDMDKVNQTGGAIAIGHPIGCSGARILVTLVHALRFQRKEIGVASLCIGGGMGIAMVLRAT